MIEEIKVKQQSEKEVFTTETAYKVTSYGGGCLTSEFRDVLKTTGINYPVPPLPEGVLSIRGLFDHCEGIVGPENFDLCEFRTEGIIDMSYLFNGCSNLKSLNINHFDTSDVRMMIGMFRKCISLEELSLTGFDTSKVKSMATIFHHCMSLRNLDINSFDTSSLKDAQKMFMGCRELEELDLSSFDTRNLVNAHQMFSSTNNLKTLDLSSFETQRLTNVVNMFEGSGIEDLKINLNKNPLHKKGVEKILERKLKSKKRHI